MGTNCFNLFSFCYIQLFISVSDLQVLLLLRFDFLGYNFAALIRATCAHAHGILMHTNLGGVMVALLLVTEGK